MYLSQNIKYLRKQEGFTQADLAERLGLKRPVIGAYEEGRAEPRLQTLQMMADFFGYSIDQLLNTDLSTGQSGLDKTGKSLRILPIAIDPDTQRERATLVPVKAAAGYLNGFGDLDFVSSLPNFNMPFPELPSDRTYRVFQIEGESMQPIPPKSYVICEYVQDWTNLKADDRYIFLTKDDGIVFKRVRIDNEKHQYELISDNPDFKPYKIKQSQVLEVWKARGVLSFNLESFSNLGRGGFREVMEAIKSLESKVVKA
jgi:transcriptional regulator with XRE-family HTH domain